MDALQIGDHLKAKYRCVGLVPYDHHGIYIGNGLVMAYSKENKNSVVERSIDEFC